MANEVKREPSDKQLDAAFRAYIEHCEQHRRQAMKAALVAAMASEVKRDDIRILYVSHEFDKTRGVVRLELWPEGLVLWVGGEIRWKEWAEK